MCNQKSHTFSAFHTDQVLFIYWIYHYDTVIATNAYSILIHNGHEAMNFILSFTILVFYAHGGEIECVPLGATNY